MHNEETGYKATDVGFFLLGKPTSALSRTDNDFPDINGIAPGWSLSSVIDNRYHLSCRALGDSAAKKKKTKRPGTGKIVESSGNGANGKLQNAIHIDPAFFCNCTDVYEYPIIASPVHFPIRSVIYSLASNRKRSIRFR